MSAMKFVTSTLFAAFFASASAAATVTLDFDELEPGTVIGSTYADLGVTFENVFVLENIPLFGGVGNRINSVSNPGNAVPENPVRAIFDTPVSLVSVTGLGIGLDGFLLRAFDAVIGGNEVDSAQRITTESNAIVGLTVVGENIRRVEFSQVSDRSGSRDTSSYDNFVFETAIAPVPLPASLPLLFGALGSVAVMRRRRARG